MEDLRAWEFGLDPDRGKMSKANIRENFRGSCLFSVHKGSMWSASNRSPEALKEARGPGRDHTGVCFFIGVVHSNLFAARVKTPSSHCQLLSGAGTGTHASTMQCAITWVLR